MPIVLRKVEDVDLSGFKHHGGGIMARGGFEIEEVEISVEEYARKLVEEASMHVAYRKWQPMEILNIGQDCRFYLFCEPDRELVLVRVNLSEKFKITGNEWWRKEARAWIVKNYDDDPLEDVVMANMLRKYGDTL